MSKFDFKALVATKKPPCGLPFRLFTPNESLASGFMTTLGVGEQANGSTVSLFRIMGDNRYHLHLSCGYAMQTQYITLTPRAALSLAYELCERDIGE